MRLAITTSTTNPRTSSVNTTHLSLNIHTSHMMRIARKTGIGASASHTRTPRVHNSHLNAHAAARVATGVRDYLPRKAARDITRSHLPLHHVMRIARVAAVSTGTGQSSNAERARSSPQCDAATSIAGGALGKLPRSATMVGYHQVTLTTSSYDARDPRGRSRHRHRPGLERRACTPRTSVPRGRKHCRRCL